MSTRLASIDQFRGFAMLTMALVNFLAGVNRVPAWLKHAPDVGLTVADLVAPFFIFAIGLTYGLSARRRFNADGTGPAVEHFLRRSLALVGIGALLSAGEIWFGFNPTGVNWGVLQAIGVATLLALPLIRLPAWARAGIGLALLGIYQIVLDRFWLPMVLASPHGGLQGSPGWAAMLILATALADLFHDLRGRRFFGWSVLLALLAGIALALWVPVSKNRVSASYVLIALGASGGLFAAFHLLVDRLSARLPLLSAWGRNPLALYVLHIPLLGLFALPDMPGWYVEAPLGVAALQALALIGLLSWAAWIMDRRGWVFSL